MHGHGCKDCQVLRVQLGERQLVSRSAAGVCCDVSMLTHISNTTRYNDLVHKDASALGLKCHMMLKLHTALPSL